MASGSTDSQCWPKPAFQRIGRDRGYRRHARLGVAWLWESKHTGSRRGALKLEGISLIDHLWNRLAGTYGGRWLKDFPDMQSIENWKTAWAEALDEDRVTPQEVAEGLRACAAACSPTGRLPWASLSGHAVRADSGERLSRRFAGMTARRRGEMGQWTHPAVYWAAVRVGSHDLLNCGYSVMQSRWERALSDELSRSDGAAIPAPAVALPAPWATQATPEEAGKALKAMGAGAILNGSGRDPRRWARRILAEAAEGGAGAVPGGAEHGAGRSGRADGRWGLSMSAMQRNKGAAFERKVVILLTDATGTTWRRRVRNQAGDCDVVADEPAFAGISVECEHANFLCLPAWWRQAVEQAGAGGVPVLIYRQTGARGETVMVDAQDVNPKIFPVLGGTPSPSDGKQLCNGCGKCCPRK